jgi:hypothetical protein
MHAPVGPLALHMRRPPIPQSVHGTLLPSVTVHAPHSPSTHLLVPGQPLIVQLGEPEHLLTQSGFVIGQAALDSKENPASASTTPAAKRTLIIESPPMRAATGRPPGAS